jgi:rare lipoprotein A
VRVEYAGRASVAGSDDRKLLASLRTDGRPAGRSAVMMADLGPSEEPERYARSAPAPLAFKPAPEREEPAETPAARPERPAPVRAPIVLASAAMTVPAAVQPTAPRVREFRPAPVQVAAKGADVKGASLRVAGLNPSLAGAAPRATGHAAPLKSAGAGRPAATEIARRQAPDPLPAPTRLAKGPPTAMPAAAKVAMARLASAAAPDKGGAPGKGGASVRNAGAVLAAVPAKTPPTRTAGSATARHARLAGIY